MSICSTALVLRDPCTCSSALVVVWSAGDGRGQALHLACLSGHAGCVAELLRLPWRHQVSCGMLDQYSPPTHKTTFVGSQHHATAMVRVVRSLTMLLRLLLGPVPLCGRGRRRLQSSRQRLRPRPRPGDVRAGVVVPICGRHRRRYESKRALLGAAGLWSTLTTSSSVSS